MVPLASVDLLLNKFTYKRRPRIQRLSSPVYTEKTKKQSIVTGFPNTAKLFNIGPSAPMMWAGCIICIFSLGSYLRPVFDLFYVPQVWAL